MRTLKMIGGFLLILLAIGVGLVLRLFGWRPDGDSGIQTLFQRVPRGSAVVSGAEADTEPYPYIYVNPDGNARELLPSEREYLETRFLGWTALGLT
jgi:hypothetical protein